MDYKIQIEDKQYVYVVSCYGLKDDLKTTDISIFEVNEWSDLLNKEELFKKWEKIVTRGSDTEYEKTPPDLRDAAYYLYHEERINKLPVLTSLEYNTGSKKEIYERLFFEAENESKCSVTVNCLRRRICDNYETLTKNYNILKMYDDK